MKTSANLLKDDPRSFRCCLCCHVKTGTLIFGIVFALIQLLALGLFILATIRPDVLITDEAQKSDGIHASIEDAFKTTGDPVDPRFTRERIYVAIGLTLVNLLAAMVMIYGVAKNLASYLMPMFCIQVFDFCLSCLSVLSCFAYAPNVKRMIHDEGLDQYPVFEHLSCIDGDYLILLLITVLILILSVKAYLLGMVWSCYRYIHLHVASRSVVREYEIDPDTQMLLPPRYEEAIKAPGQLPPPAYSVE